MYNLSRKIAYLKSEIVEIGRFWAISGLFLDSARFCRFEWGAGLNYYAWGDGRGFKLRLMRWEGLNYYARGDGRGLK